ncbi:hypothetical protein GCM10023340_32450 [Nocardioides marinquilinus]|uniref:Aminoglycoside phosphotransferase domain-containing protein n=1 Tax=Nocardioides marinquilinus TaxID=1210400 RepID=A0ABP9PUA4_9ACTN
MTDRAALGPADVDDDRLAVMVEALLGEPARVVATRVEPVAHEIPALTTVGRHWVHVTAETAAGERDVRLFVKHVQAWHHSPFFASVPPEARQMAAASYPWRTEGAVYRSDLCDRLPAGLSMPRALAVVDLEPDAQALWLEDVTAPPAPWDDARYARAARLLGRLAASPAVAPLADVGAFDWSVLHYVHGRLAPDVVPRLLADDAWAAPEVAGAFEPALRTRLREAAGRVADLGAELAALPRTTSHGDACPNNLLPSTDPDGFVLVDFGFWLRQPVGFDLGQLLAGEVQLGRDRCDVAALAARDEACLAAYVAGLADEGLDLDPALVRRAHAVQLFLFAGVSSVPEGPVTAQQAEARAALATHSLGLLALTD